MELHAVFHSAVHGLASKDYTREQIEAWSPDELTSELRERWGARIRAIQPWVLEIKGQVVAYADLQPNGYIDQFFVDAQFGRQGVGSRLMRHLHDVCHSQRIGKLSSDVSRTAQPFFKRFGFSLVEERSRVIRGIVLSNALMTKEMAADLF